ncbi:unnamed protein product [Bemisia tabaci]|uniref:Uncharacterized protein n=1 Tax=Bemisia tabaci TaxID=7038 RepID=A0A9P0A5A9_BEMTA|nr:unnamed protein product [Bemisia tabaci]
MIAVKILIVSGLLIMGPELCQQTKPHDSPPPKRPSPDRHHISTEHGPRHPPPQSPANHRIEHLVASSHKDHPSHSGPLSPSPIGGRANHRPPPKKYVQKQPAPDHHNRQKVHSYEPGSPNSVLPQENPPAKRTHLGDELADTADSSRKRKQEEIPASQEEAKKKRSDPSSLQSTPQGGRKQGEGDRDPRRPFHIKYAGLPPVSRPLAKGPIKLQFKGKPPVSAPPVKGPNKLQFKGKPPVPAPQVNLPPIGAYIKLHNCTEECKKKEGFVERGGQQPPILIAVSKLDAQGNCTACEVNKEFLDYLTQTLKVNSIAFMAAHAKSPKEGRDWLAARKIEVKFTQPESPKKWTLKECTDDCQQADGYVMGTNQEKIFLSEGSVNEQQNCKCNVTTGIIDFLKKKGLNTTAFEAEREKTLYRGHAWLQQHQIKVLGVRPVE